MENTLSTRFIKLYSWFIFVLGLSVLLSLIIGLFTESWQSIIPNNLSESSVLVAGILAIPISFGLRKLKRWAFIMAEVLSVLLIISIFWMLQSINAFDYSIRGNIAFIPSVIQMLVLVMPAIYLFTKKDLFK